MNTEVDGSKTKGCTPLWIQPLTNRKISPEEGTGSSETGSYRIIQKLVTASPNRKLPDAEIETSLEAFVAPNGDCLWRRVAVWSGPCTPQRVIHASYVLPSTGDSATQSGCIFDPPVDSLKQPSLVCWAAFPERPTHKLLCVLVNPSTLSIWDVYPDSDKVYVSGEGHSVSLPFHCCGIYPLGENHGLLLQRKEENEDFEAQKGTWGLFQNLNASQASEEEDDFFLKIPPRNTQMGEQEGVTASHLAGSVGPTSPRSAFGPAEVSSLFSLTHPLEDVLPVMRNSENGSDASLVTDVFDRVLYTGVMRWTDHADGYLDKKQHEQPICVTYHSIRKRHAVWALKGAPTPPPAPALWQRSRYWRSTKDWESHIGMLDQDMEDMELLGVASEGSVFAGPTRDEALADALGVRRTPRRSAEGAQRGRGLESLSRNRAEAASVNRSTFVQGPPRSAKDTFLMDTDAPLVETPHLLNLRPLSNLHPSVALECLYEESDESSPATNVFLSSNLAGSGLLVLGLVTARSDGEMGENLNVLRLISFEPSLDEPLAEQEIDSHNFVGALSESLRHTFSKKMISEEVCIAAQPIQATPIPLCHLPHQRNRNGNELELATDILILKNDGTGQSTMSLYRAQTCILDCALYEENCESEQAASYITDIQNPVRGSIEIVRRNDLEDGPSIRGNISLSMQSSALAEKVLVAIENSMFQRSESQSSTVPLEFALKLRADCCRLQQQLDSVTSVPNQFLDHDSLAVFQTLFACIIDFELFGASPDAPSRSATDNNGSAWSMLLDSSFHASYFAENSDALFLGDTDKSFSDKASRCLHSKEKRLRSLLYSIGIQTLCTLSRMIVVQNIFDTLHLLYEDLKLSSVSNKPDQMRSVGFCLVRACCATEMPNASKSVFLEHYARDLGSEWVSDVQRYLNKSILCTKREMVQITSFDRPPCILSWVDALFKEATSKSYYNIDDISMINAACSRTRSVLRIFSLLFQCKTDSQKRRDYKVVSAMVEEDLTDVMKVRDELPVGIAVPLLEVLNRCRDDPDLGTLSGWSADKFNLVGRQDLSKNSGNDPLEVPGNSKNKTVPVRVSDRDNPTFSDKDKDGLVPLEVSSSMLFPDDNRIREAGRLLRSSRPCFLSVPRSVEVSDHDYERLKQNKLLLLCRRALALPVGRGMVTIGTFQPVAAEPLPVPDLCLVGRIPPTNTNLALDMSECQSDFKIWPDFHNGVAAGLRLPLEGEIEESISKITRTWIVYNRPTAAPEAQPPNQSSQPPTSPTINSHAHGGLLLALGLRGHLAELEMTDLYDYLTQGQVTLTCGVLLGMAANKRATCDISVSKMLCLHLPSLIPQHFSAIDVASPVQTAAVAGAGLLFQGSCHRMMTEFLLNEIGRRPESDVALDREAYTLSCGIALGMVNICKGDRIHDGQSAGGGEGLADLRIGERLYRYIVGGTDDEEARRMREANDRLDLPTTSSSGENERCSCVFEGDNVNIDVTAAGATLAIGLIFMKSGNANIASAIALPDTHFLLEYVRPDFLALRVISKALILWDDVEPSDEWIAKQIPSVVRSAYKQMENKIRKATDLRDVFSEKGRDALEVGNDSERHPQDYDCQAVRQIYVHILAGACFGIGLRYAGTADKRASAAIFERVIELQTLRDANDSISAAMRPEEQILDTCLGSCAMSLAMVNAGTGDLEVLKLLKILRWRCDDTVKYGTHQSLGMAIGLLFLGGGTCTLGREPEDIAALVAAFFPRFPYSTNDNQYHLQALRHLYALAVKRRDLRFVDVDTGENIHIPIEISYRNQASNPVRLMAPCLLRNSDRPPFRARIVSDHFYPMRFNLNKAAFGRPFFVKRRSKNQIPDEGEDSDLQRSLLVQTGNFRGDGFLDLAGNPYILAYARYFCSNIESSRNKKTKSDTSVEALCTSVLHECLSGEAEVSLPVYLGLQNSIASIEANSSSASQSSWDFRLIRSYYESRGAPHCSTARPILSIDKVALLSELFEASMATLSLHNQKCASIFYDVPITADE